MQQSIQVESAPIVAQALALTVLPKHCHKSEERNAFIKEAEQIGENYFCLTAEIDHQAEGFFFDHQIDHIPGMLIACILRQSVLVISHLFYNVPFSRRFLMDDISMKFSRHAALEEPITVKARFENLKRRGSEVRAAECVVDVYQNDSLISSGSLGFRALSPEVARRLELKQQSGQRG